MCDFPTNKEFPPDYKKYGDKYHGYKNGDHEVILYDFAVQNCDLDLVYKGKAYYFQNDVSGTYQCFGQDGNMTRFGSPYGHYFKDANDLIKNFVLDDGKHIIDVLDNIEHAEPY
ncbi:MAG: hypothetical protein J6W06_00855 [Bacteroidales bacterium]|nr:hypothetical protein [Bacteroidales bacterium]